MIMEKKLQIRILFHKKQNIKYMQVYWGVKMHII